MAAQPEIKPTPSTRPHKAALIFALIALAVLLISRLHYAPPYLFFFDHANFAFALSRFDPAMHQPQPPGYPLFVALLHVIEPFAGNPNGALIFAGILASAVALALLWLWTDLMFGRVAACLATGLLLFHPVFWLAGAVNPVRVFLAVAVSAAGLTAWRTIVSQAPAPAFYTSAVTLGLVSGFRPEALLLLAPLWLAPAIYRRLSARTTLIGFAILLSATAVWLVPMVVRLGGFGPMFHVFHEYVGARSIGRAAFFGASSKQSLATIRTVIVWITGYTLVWVWLLPLVWTRFVTRWDRPRILIAIAAFLPALFFYAFVHVRDVDQALLPIPVTCIAGGVALASVRSRNLMIATSLLAAVGSYWLFRRPIFPEMTAASGSAIRYVNESNSTAYKALNQLAFQPDTILVWRNALVPWRNISYYYPQLPILVADERPFWVHWRRGRPPTIESSGAVSLPPSATRLIVSLSPQFATAAARKLPLARRIGPLEIFNLTAGQCVAVGSVTLRTAGLGAAPAHCTDL